MDVLNDFISTPIGSEDNRITIGEYFDNCSTIKNKNVAIYQAEIAGVISLPQYRNNKFITIYLREKIAEIDSLMKSMMEKF